VFLGRRLDGLGRRVNLIVNYDNFELGRAAAPRLFELVRGHERRCFLSSMCYSTGAFLRRELGCGRELGCAFADARLSQTIYRGFQESIHALAPGAARGRPAVIPRDAPVWTLRTVVLGLVVRSWRRVGRPGSAWSTSRLRLHVRLRSENDAAVVPTYRPRTIHRWQPRARRLVSPGRDQGPAAIRPPIAAVATRRRVLCLKPSSSTPSGRLSGGP